MVPFCPFGAFRALGLGSGPWFLSLIGFWSWAPRTSSQWALPWPPMAPRPLALCAGGLWPAGFWGVGPLPGFSSLAGLGSLAFGPMGPPGVINRPSCKLNLAFVHQGLLLCLGPWVLGSPFGHGALCAMVLPLACSCHGTAMVLRAGSASPLGAGLGPNLRPF